MHAQRLASVEHPNVVPLYDYWREPGGAFLVTRYLAGGTLAHRLADPELLDEDEAVAIIRDVGMALVAVTERAPDLP